MEEIDEFCPACDARYIRTLFRTTDRLYRTTGKTFLVVECVDCRLMRLYPRPTPRELRHYYPPEYWFAPTGEAASILEEHYRRLVLQDHVRFVRHAIERSGESGLLLDVGCGGGLFLDMMRDGGRQVVGLDFSLGAAALTWSKRKVPAVCAMLSHAPLPPSSCAAVTMFHVLEHLYDPASYVEAAHRLLRPDGRLIVQVPDASSWQFLLFGAHWSGLDAPRHLWNFRARDLEVLLEHCGFEVLRSKHFSLRDNPAAFATSLAPSLDPMARRIRRLTESPQMRLFKDVLYFALVLAGLPLSLLEAACRTGATVMMEARKKQ